MINTLGDRMNEEKAIIADADIIISLYFIDDANHQKVSDLVSKAVNSFYVIKYPNTVILEAITTLKRSLNKPEIAAMVNNDFLDGKFNIIYVDEEIQKLASEIFVKAKSKKNTIFDAVVLATAKTLKAAGVFSFDSWYSKQGAKTVSDLI